MSEISCLIEENDVINAVENLNQLNQRIKETQIKFENEDVFVIDNIIECLNDLNIARIRSHEMYETETIKASALRHKLVNFPAEINHEIEEAVKAARGLNQDTIDDLTSRLEKILANIRELQHKTIYLDDENKKLSVERDKVRMDHERIVLELNSKLGNKADNQICLNETNNAIMYTNRRIVDLQEDVSQLKEIMVQEREQFRQQKKDLTRTTNENSELWKIQKANNDVLKSEYKSLSHEVTTSNLKIDEINASINTIEANIKKLLHEEKTLSNQLREEQDSTIRLQDVGINIRDDIQTMTDKFNAAVVAIKNRKFELENGIKKQEEKRVLLLSQHAGLEEMVKKAIESRDAKLNEMHQLNEKLQQAKDDSATKVEDMGRMQKEILDMEERRVSIAEHHKSTMAILGNQISELRTQLSRERQERVEVQKENDTLSKEIFEFREENAKFMKEMNKRITDGKQEHDRLNKERTRLQQCIESDKSLSQELAQNLSTKLAELSSTENRLTERIKRLEVEIEENTLSIQQHETEIATLTPEFLEFEVYYNTSCEKYDTLKKDFIKRKNLRQTLDDNSKRTDMSISKQQPNLLQLSLELERKRTKSMDQIQQQADEVNNIEKNIYVEGCKLKAVLEENARFEAHLKELMLNIQNMREDWEEAIRSRSVLFRELNQQKSILEEGWNEDRQMTDFFANKDQVMLVELRRLMNCMDDRRQLTADITNRLEIELENFTEFIETIGSRRSNLSRKVTNVSKSQTLQSMQKLLVHNDLASL